MKDYKQFLNENISDYGNYKYPMSTINSLMNYYKCNNCNAMYKEFNKPESKTCNFCKKDTLILMDGEDWYDELIDSGRIDAGEVDIVRKEQQREYEPIDLVSLGKYKDMMDKRKNIN